ncbi:MAG: hypothetical protein EP338_04955 [Bacteroidetes bacterium]|nr:MAG: hypothetical protein EP338_04955 [Bacteroidota bacterium]
MITHFKQLYFIVFFGLIYLNGFSQSWTPCRKIESLKAQFNAWNVRSLKFDPVTRQNLVSFWVDEADRNNLLFSNEQVNEMKNLATKTEICPLYDSLKMTYLKALGDWNKRVQLELSKKISFNEDLFLTYNLSSKKHLRPDQSKLKEQNRKQLLEKLLNDLYELREEDQKSDFLTPELIKKTVDELRLEEKENHDRIVDRVQNEDYLLQLFLDAMTKCYDPHSSYFNQNEKKEFEQELSADIRIFGLQFFSNELEQIEISHIVPGSAAWNSGGMKKGDIIEAVQVQGRSKKNLNETSSMKELSDLLSSEGVDIVTFYLKSGNGSKTKIKLIRTAIENRENSFSGYVVRSEGKKLGYIALPSFYVDQESENELGCANDVAREIIQLKRDSIQGLILDLRNNGGGSLQEAVELAGLFIDVGPIGIYQFGEEKARLLKDPNRGVVYDGPLLILVNSMSASASELFAGCMQDYRRAVIAGDRTFGKGSSQNIFFLDTLGKNPAVGFTKITNGRFYHVSGRSNQELGIVPDVTILDVFSALSETREESFPEHLKNRASNKQVRYQALDSIPIGQLREKSTNRQKKDVYLSKLQEKADQLKQKVEKNVQIPLKKEDYFNYRAQEQEFWEQIYEDHIDTNQLTFGNHSFANRVILTDRLEAEFYKQIKEQMANDAVLREGLFILNDFINLRKQ